MGEWFIFYLELLHENGLTTALTRIDKSASLPYKPVMRDVKANFNGASTGHSITDCKGRKLLLTEEEVFSSQI